jgi:hypothetical protein
MLFLRDFWTAVFKPSKFFTERFSAISKTRIEFLGFVGIFCGIALGNLFTYALASVAAREFLINPEPYMQALASLKIESAQFVELLVVQKAYSLMLIIVSPLISYMGSHIFGGALYALIWLLMAQDRQKLDVQRTMNVASIALCSVIFYIIPGVGPLIAVVMVAINTSKGLRLLYNVVGFLKASCVLVAVYICFFLSAASLQLLAYPFSKLLQGN